MPRGARLVLLVAAAASVVVWAAPGVISAPQGSIAPAVVGRSITVEDDQTVIGGVADFTCFCGRTSTFTVSIAWGDGSQSAGTAVCTFMDGQEVDHWRAEGSYRYTTAGTYTTTIVVT